MTVPVVDLLQIGDVGETDRRRDKGPFDAIHLLVEQHQTGFPVDQTGFLVKGGVITKVLLRFLDLVDACQTKHMNPAAAKRGAG